LNSPTLFLGVTTVIYLFINVRKEYAPVEYEHPERRKRKRVAKIVGAPEPPPVVIKPKPKCLYCDTEIPENAEYCPHCGKAIKR
jgi:hypothetical protein